VLTGRESRTALLVSVIVTLFVASHALGQAFCAPPNAMPKDPPPPPPPAICEPRVCDTCTNSPCYVDSGIYVADVTDLTIPTNGFPLRLSRHYDSSVTADGPLGIGWASSLTAHLYYATYLYAANVYQYEAEVVMPDGAQYRFTSNGDGTFTPPAGRRDVLVRNADGTFVMTLQRSRSRYSFGNDGSLTSMSDDFGNTLAFSYDANARIQTIADTSGSGRSLTVAWNPQGRIADVSDSASPARHVVYSYGAEGTLAGIRDPITPSDKQSASYAYTGGRFGPVLAVITDRWGRVMSRLTWQTDGKLSSYTDGDFDDINPASSTGEQYVYSYGVGITHKQTSLGSIAHSYASGGLITDHAQYDATGNVTSATDGGGAQTLYQYDSRGNVSKVSRHVPTIFPAPCCDVVDDWNYTYDPNFPDQVATITPADPTGAPLTNFASWAYDYNLPSENAPGAIKRVKRYNMSRTATETMATYTYDAKGHVIFGTDNLGRGSTFVYDAAGNTTSATVAGQTTTYAYDSVGRITRSTDAAGHATDFEYDALDRLVSITLPPPSTAPLPPFKITYSYDNLIDGLVYVNVTDPNHHVTSNGYDALGHLIRAVDALGNATQFTYQYNLLKSVTDANGNVTSYSYDANRNLIQTTLPDGAVESYQTAWDGTLISSTDRRGIKTSYERDGLSRIARTTYSSGFTTLGIIDYMFNGEQLTSVVAGPAGQSTTTTSFTYDPFWRLASEAHVGDYTITYQNTTPFPSGMSGYTVAPASGQTGPTNTVTYGRDSNQRINSIVWSAVPGSFTIEYDPLGQYSRITFPNGQTREFTYDNQGRLTSLANRAPSSDLAIFQYGYDYDGSGAPTLLGQRTSLAASGAATMNDQTKYGYDANYQLASTAQGSVVRSWQYDAIGNRVFSSYPWTYYKNGTNPLNGQRLRSDGGADITYDANGNMTGRAGQPLYTWDYANRLSNVAANPAINYTYDYLGRRASTSAGGQTTKYVLQGLNTVGERSGTTVRDYLFAPGVDEPLAMVGNGVASYFLVDGLGSVVAATTSSASVVSATTYDAWGTVIGYPVVPTATTLFGYTGRENDVSGSLYSRARWYAPNWGRFLSEDPVRSADNAYVYVANMPVIATDPSGLVIKRCYRTFSGAKNKVLGGLALASALGAVQPPVPGTKWCPMHEYLYNTETGTAQGYDPKEKNAKETGKNICYDIPEPLGKCVWENFEKVHGPTSNYSLLTNNCQTSINDTVQYCQQCKAKGVAK